MVKRLKHNNNTDHQNTGYDIFKSFDVAFYDRENDDFLVPSEEEIFEGLIPDRKPSGFCMQGALPHVSNPLVT